MMSQESTEAPTPPWKLLTCIILGSLFITLFFVTPALYHAPQIVMGDWRVILIQIAALQVVLLGGGLFLIVVPFSRHFAQRCKCLAAALLVGFLAAFYPVILQLVEGEKIVQGELKSLVWEGGGQIALTSPQTKHTHFVQQRSYILLELAGKEGVPQTAKILESHASRVTQVCAVGDSIELMYLSSLKVPLSVKKLD